MLYINQSTAPSTEILATTMMVFMVQGLLSSLIVSLMYSFLAAKLGNSCLTRFGKLSFVGKNEFQGNCILLVQAVKTSQCVFAVLFRSLE